VGKIKAKTIATRLELTPEKPIPMLKNFCEMGPRVEANSNIFLWKVAVKKPKETTRMSEVNCLMKIELTFSKITPMEIKPDTEMQIHKKRRGGVDTLLNRKFEKMKLRMLATLLTKKTLT
jgi:hypothetical protein